MEKAYGFESRVEAERRQRANAEAQAAALQAASAADRDRIEQALFGGRGGRAGGDGGDGGQRRSYIGPPLSPGGDDHDDEDGGRDDAYGASGEERHATRGARREDVDWEAMFQQHQQHQQREGNDSLDLSDDPDDGHGAGGAVGGEDGTSTPLIRGQGRNSFVEAVTPEQRVCILEGSGGGGTGVF